MVPAVLGSARLANFRLASIPVDLAAIRRTSVRILLGGVDVTARVLRRSVTIRDQLNDSPNTCSLTLKDDPPPPDVADLRVSIGTDQPTLLFSGTLQTSANTFTGRPGNLLYPVTALDDSARANRKRPFGKYTNVSATTVARDVVARFAPGFTTYHVQEGLEPISVTFDGSEGFTGSLRAIAKLIGGYFYFLDLDLHLFTVESDPATLPDPIDYAHAFLYDPHIAVMRDFSQLRTRVYGRGLGAALLSDIAAGEPFLPIENTTSFNPAGGQAIAESQIVAYTRTQIGGAGSLVGPGAAPANAPVVAGVSGSGIESGSHAWAVTFVTASGESLPGPVGVLTLGALAAPPAAPIVSGPTSGTGPDPGTHSYAVTFVTATGETAPGPSVTVATTVTPPPLTAPVVGTPAPGPGPDPGDHDYAVSFVTAIGETELGPLSSAVVTAVTPAPASALTPGAPTIGAGPDNGNHEYAVTFLTAVGETLPGPISAVVTTTFTTVTPPAPAPAATATNLNSSDLQVGDVVYYRCTYLNAIGETNAGTPSNTVVIGGGTGGFPPEGVLVTTPALALGATGGRIYRNVNGAWTNYGTFFQAGTYTDNGFNGVGFGAPPAGNSAAYELHVVPLNAIPRGDATVTSRRIYRRFNGAGPFRLALTIYNNTATGGYLDYVTNANLGAAAPSAHTALVQTVSLSSIPTGDANVTERHVYRRSGGAGFRRLTTIPNNYVQTTYTDTTPNAGLGAAPSSVNTAYLQRFTLTGLPIGGGLVTNRRVYRTAANGSTLQLVATITATQSTFLDTVPDASLGAAPPAGGGTAAVNQAQLSSLQLGTGTVLTRKVYRTAAGGSQLKLLTTIGDNTTNTYLDALADAMLGTNAPAADTSGLTQPAGQVLAGSTSLPVASGGAPFAPGGGWVIIGSQVVRYHGISGNILTGIPGAGQPGSLVNTVRYGEHVDAAPVLEGVTGLGQPALKGIVVSIWVQRDDLEAQAAMIAIDAAQGRTSDGVYEYRISDERRAEASLIALCDADLQQFSRPLITVTYATRDLKTKSGKPVTFNLDSPSLHGTLTIQDVTITDIAIAQNLLPTFTVTASSVRYSLEDLLRQLAARVGV